MEHARGPARVLAPAGAGKTKTLVARVARLIQRGADPADILLLAFNRKAAEQLEERLAARGIATTRRLGSPAAAQRPAGVHCATFNAFGYRYQREVMGARVLVDQRGAELRGLMRRALDAAGISPAQLKPPRGSDPVGACLHALTHVRAGLQAPAAVELNLESTGDEALVAVPFADLHDHYVRAQAVTGRQSFDDQIYFAVADMLADPGHRAFIQARFRHVLVDEFQDLNPGTARPRGPALAAHARPLRGGRRRPAHLRLAPGRPARHPAVPRAHAAEALVCHLHAGHQLPLLAGGGGRRRRASWPTTASARPRPCSPRAVRSRARCASRARPRGRGAPRLMCAFLRTDTAPGLRLARPGRALPLPGAAVRRGPGARRGAHTAHPTLGCRLFTHPVARLLRAYIDLVRAPQALAGDELAFLLNRPTRYQTASFTAAVAAAERPWSACRRARPRSLRPGRARSRC